MRQRPTRVTRTETLLPTRRAADLVDHPDRRGLHLDQPFDRRARLFEREAGILQRGHRRFDIVQRGNEFGARGAAGVVPCRRRDRSEEHTSELQSLMRISYAVFCLKKKTKTTAHTTYTTMQHNI